MQPFVPRHQGNAITFRQRDDLQTGAVVMHIAVHEGLDEQQFDKAIEVLRDFLAWVKQHEAPYQLVLELNTVLISPQHAKAVILTLRENTGFLSYLCSTLIFTHPFAKTVLDGVFTFCPPKRPLRTYCVGESTNSWDKGMRFLRRHSAPVRFDSAGSQPADDQE